MVGGTAGADRNVISGNNLDGIYVVGSSGNIIRGNYIGTDRTGMIAVGNSEDGIWLDNASNTTVGGSVSGAGNVISGNGWSGVAFLNGGSGNIVQGNLIGVNAAGTGPLSNGHHGIDIAGSSGTTVGGLAAGQANVIAHNTWDGVSITSGTGHTISGNSIHSNGGLGIDIGNDAVTPNDLLPGDLDGGANNQQNFPVLTSATVNGGQISITGTLSSSLTGSFRIEFFASSATDPTGHGEGQRYLGSSTVSTLLGSATINVTLLAAVTPGEFVSATATSLATGDTSELAATVSATGNTAPVVSLPVSPTVPEDAPLAFTGANQITVADGENNLVQVTLTVLNGTLTAAAAGGAVVSGSGTSIVTINGIQSAIAATLASVSYQGASNYSGPEQLTVTATDAGGLQDTESVAVTVTPVNDAPAGTDATVTTNEDVAHVFTVANFGFTDVDALDTMSAVRIDTIPAGGTLTLNAVALTAGQVILVADINAGLLRFNPAPDASGVPYTTFTFSVRDSGGPAFDPAPNSLTINVTAVNDTPVANNASASGNEDDPQIAITVTGTDVEGSIASFRLIGLPTNGVLYIDPGLTTLAAVATDYAATGNARTFYFVPAGNWNGATSFQFTAVDGGGLTDATPANATINVTPINDAPVANNASAAGNEDDAQIAITLSGSDLEGPVASFRLAGLPANGLLYVDSGLTTLAAVATDYAATGNARTFYFVPAGNWNGTTSFQFTAVDGGGLTDATPVTATINVLPVNDAPAGNDVTASGNEDDAQIAITLTGSDVEGSLASFRLAGLPANGVLYTDVGLTFLAATGTDYAAVGDALTLYFVPASNWSGATSFQFTAVDAGGLADATPANATINVLPVNDAPAANDVSALGNEDDSQIALTLTAADVDGAIASFRLLGLPANGVLYTDAGLTLLAAVATDYAAAGNALTLYFVPAANWNGTTGFQFTAVDGGGLTDATPATATINVLPVSDAPAGNDVTASGNEDDAQIAITLTGSDVEGPIASFRLAGLPANGFLYIDPGLTTLAAVATDYAAAGNARTFYFVPAGNWNGTTTFQFTANDAGGLSDATPANATINVLPVNDAPVANNASTSGNEDDAQIAITLTGADTEGPIASFRLIGLPVNGVLYIDPGLTSLAAVATDYAATGNARTFYFVPAGNWNGTTGFQFTAVDGGGLTDATPANAAITVTPVNDVPAAVADAAATNENTPVTTGDVLANDSLGDTPTTITAFDALSARGGTVVLNAGNTFTYTPAASFSGTDTFTYTIQDADGDSATGTVTVTVANVANDAPVNRVPGAQISAEDVALVFSTGNGNAISVSDPDAGASPLQVTLTANQGTLTLAGTAGLTFIVGGGTGDATMTFSGTQAAINAALDGMSLLPPLNYTGPASVTITTDDMGATGGGGPLSDTDTVDVTVNVVNDAPTLDLDANDSSGAVGANYVRTFTEGLGSVRITDVDAALGDIDSPSLASLTVTITNFLDGVNEVLTANTGATAITATYAGGVLTLNGADTLANYQTVLRTIRYENLADAPSLAARTITFVASDGGSASNVGTATVTIAAVNDGPSADIVPAAYAATENVPLALHGTGLSVADIDALPSSIVTVQLRSISGLISAAAGSTGVTVAGSGSPLLTLTGTLARVNALLAGAGGGTVTYLVGSDSPAPTDSLTLSISDNGATGAGGALWASDSATVNLTAVNDAPLITIPGLAATPEDTPAVFSAGGGNRISITDVDAGGAPVAVTLNVSTGVLTLSGTAGLTFTAGDGTADASMTFTGTIAAINAALDGLAFTPAANYSGSAFLSVSVDDQGNSGAGGALSDADFCTITVGAVNDLPAGTNNTLSLPQDTQRVFIVADFGFTDPDAGDNLSAVRVDTLSLPPGATLQVSGTNVIAGQVVLVADITAGNLVFTPALGASGLSYASFTFSVRDAGGAFDAAPNALTLNVVTPVNNPPAGTDATVTTVESTARVFAVGDFGFIDADAGDSLSAVQINTLPVTGLLTLSAVPVIASQVIAVADITAGNLVFTPVPATIGSPYASFTFTVFDSNGPDFDPVPNTLTVSVVAATNAPVNTVPGPRVVNEDTAVTIAGISVSDPNADLATVQTRRTQRYGHRQPRRRREHQLRCERQSDADARRHAGRRSMPRSPR